MADPVANPGNPGRMECGVCWQVYDPQQGDPEWQIEPGTPFSALPPGWACPNCGSPPERFLHLDRASPRGDDMAQRREALVAAYQAIHRDAMHDLPLCNPALSVESTPLIRLDQSCWIGVLVTPWFMNVVLLPADPAGWPEQKTGEVDARQLPAGEYEFIHAQLEAVGPLRICSLFSPMFEFADQAAAMATAAEALKLLLTHPQPAAPQPAASMSRRRFLAGATD